MYKDALKTLQSKFGQPQAVVTAYLDKLANVPLVKMRNSESIIRNSATVVGVYRFLNHNHDLSSASLLSHAVQKFLPNMYNKRASNSKQLFSLATDKERKRDKQNSKT